MLWPPLIITMRALLCFQVRDAGQGKANLTLTDHLRTSLEARPSVALGSKTCRTGTKKLFSAKIFYSGKKDAGRKPRQMCLTVLAGLDADVRSPGGKPLSDGFRSPLQLSVAQHKLPVNKAFCKTPVALEGCQRDIQQLGDFVFCQAAKES